MTWRIYPLFFMQHRSQSSCTFSTAYKCFATVQLSISTEYKNYFDQQKYLITKDNKNAVFMKCHLPPSSTHRSQSWKELSSQWTSLHQSRLSHLQYFFSTWYLLSSYPKWDKDIVNYKVLALSLADNFWSLLLLGRFSHILCQIVCVTNH